MISIYRFIALFGFFVISLGAESFTANFSELKSKNNTVRVVDSGPYEGSSIGSYALYVYDSDGINFINGLISQRDGSVINSWIKDEKNGFKLWVFTQDVGSGGYGKLDGFVYEDGVLTRAKPLPEPQKSMLQGYMGHDNYMFKNGVIYREFPVYKPNDANAKPSGGTRCLELSQKEDRWIESKGCGK